MAATQQQKEKNTRQQYLSLPHLFLPGSGSPVGFLLNFNKIFKKAFSHIFSFPFLLDSNWTYTKWRQWIPTGISYKLLTFDIPTTFSINILTSEPYATWEFHTKIIFEHRCGINNYLHIVLPELSLAWLSHVSWAKNSQAEPFSRLERPQPLSVAYKPASKRLSQLSHHFYPDLECYKQVITMPICDTLLFICISLPSDV